ncbi:MAG TPA: hypothetical protein DEG71_03065 [Clostridiales bacterium]|nr:hypothetical protein [Clostridiales bacterium]
MIVYLIVNNWDKIKQTTANVFTAIKEFIVNVWGGIKSAITTAVDTIKTTVLSWVDNVKSGITNGFETMKTSIINIWNGISDGITGIVDGIIGTVKGVIDWVAKALDQINIFKKANSEAKSQSTITVSSGGSTGTTRKYASGTIFHHGGLAMVGEFGKELVELPRGSRVYPASQTEQIIRETGNDGIVQNITINTNQSISPYEVARQMKMASRELALEWGRA